MLNKFLNNILNSNSRLLSEAKEKVEDTAKKKVNDILGDKIPNPQELQEELQNKLNNPTQEQLLAADKIYKKFINAIDIAINKLEAKKADLESIKIKLESILNNITIFRDFIEIISPILSAIRLAIPAINGTLAASTALAASGTVISNLTLRKKELKDNLKRASDGINSFEDPSNFFIIEVNKILNPINKALEKINSLINFLLGIKEQLQALYTKFIGDIGLFAEEDENEELGNTEITESDVINDPDLLLEIIPSTVMPNKSFIVRKNGQLVQYKVGSSPPTLDELNSIDSSK